MSVPGIQKHHENAIITSFKTSPHSICHQNSFKAPLWPASGSGLDSGWPRDVGARHIKCGLVSKLLRRAFSWHPWIPGTLKFDLILSLFKCEAYALYFFLLKWYEYLHLTHTPLSDCSIMTSLENFMGWLLQTESASMSK